MWWAKDTLFAFSKDSPFTLANRILIPGYVSCWGFFSLKEGGPRSGLECGMTQFWPKRCNRKCAEGPLGKSYSWSEESSWLKKLNSLKPLVFCLWKPQCDDQICGRHLKMLKERPRTSRDSNPESWHHWQANMSSHPPRDSLMYKKNNLLLARSFLLLPSITCSK